MTKGLLVALATLALAGSALVACGGDDDESSSTAVESTSSTETGGGALFAAEADPGGSLAWTETELTGAAGSGTIEMVNESSTPHNLLVEDDAGSVLAETDTVTGETATADAELQAGTYTFFCDVPGHVQSMNETITVE